MSAPAPIRGDHEWVIYDERTPKLQCGFCGETETRWPGEPNIGKALPHFALRHLQLPGTWTLGVGPDHTGATGLVVLVDVQNWMGEPAGQLPNLCKQIPAEAYERYAAEIADRLAS